MSRPPTDPNNPFGSNHGHSSQQHQGYANQGYESGDDYERAYASEEGSADSQGRGAQDYSQSTLSRHHTLSEEGGGLSACKRNRRKSGKKEQNRRAVEGTKLILLYSRLEQMTGRKKATEAGSTAPNRRSRMVVARRNLQGRSKALMTEMAPALRVALPILSPHLPMAALTRD